MMFSLIGVLITISLRLGATMKTTPPDEIIAILERGAYNKHHLPTHFALNATDTAEKILRGAEGYELTLVHFQSVSENKIKLVQKDSASAQWSRIEMSQAAATELCDHLSSFVAYSHLSGSGVISDSLSRSSASDWPGPSLTNDARATDKSRAKQESLHSVEIRVDPRRRYFINFLRKSRDTHLLITEAKRKGKRSTVAIPFAFWQNVSDILDEFVTTKFTAAPGPPTDVTISIYIEGMSSFRAQSMDFHVDIYLAEDWNDPRLRHNNTEPALLRDWIIFESLWHPDLYFANAKEAKYHTVTAQNFGVYIWPNGSIHLDIRVSLVVNCMMDLSRFPLDTQECFIRILSYAYDIDHLNITWKTDESITKNPDILLPDMHLEAYKAGYCDGTYAVGVWSCALASFKMKREIMHHILQSYIPTALIVVISWFSFWLDAESVPGRVSLCITTLLTLATQAQAAKMSLPQVSYAKAIDVWMGVCMAFVFGVMIEFTMVNYISRRTGAKPKRAAKHAAAKRRHSGFCRFSASSSGVSTAPRCLPEFNNLYFDITAVAGQCESTMTTPNDKEPSNGCANHSGEQEGFESTSGQDENGEQQQPAPRLTPEQQQQRMKNRKLAAKVDGINRYVFPFSFVLFNAIYWPYYLRDRDYISTGSI